jgi:hypothetical protein
MAVLATTSRCCTDASQGIVPRKEDEEARKEDESALLVSKMQAIAEHLSCPISMTLLTDPMVIALWRIESVEYAKGAGNHAPSDISAFLCVEGGCG